MTKYEDTPGRWQQEVERRLRALETGPRAPFTSIPDEDGNELVRLSKEGLEFFDATTGERIVAITAAGVRVYDENGLTRALLGRIASGNYGMRVRDGNNGLRFSIENDGYHDPWLASPMIEAGAFMNITDASFVPVYQGHVMLVTHEGMGMTVVVSTDVGTEAEFRVKNTSTGATTDVVAVGSGGSVGIDFQWLHGATLGTGPVRFDLEARRTSGAGNVIVYQPYSLSMIDPDQCTANGL